MRVLQQVLLVLRPFKEIIVLDGNRQCFLLRRSLRIDGTRTNSCQVVLFLGFHPYK